MEQPPKLPRIPALTDVDFGQQHDELMHYLEKLTFKAGPEGMIDASRVSSALTNLLANLSARVQVLEQLAIRDGKYPTEYE
ncbi:hypothetical protein ACT3OH_16085 [Vreelandella zhanjiangensis]|uniref:hypothetical protein n=1 Tax=Vreelandella zhanjiangensis TaxID=1121960 RepID=UPI00402AA8A7